MKHIIFSEYILILSGLGILISVPLIFLWGVFGFWIGAKVLYGIGVLLFVINK
jgi:hypothetical protein